MNTRTMNLSESGRMVVLALTFTFLSTLYSGCGDEKDSIELIGDPAAKILALESENTKLQSENQTKSEQLAVLNANIPGGLALGERAKQLDEREARLAQTEEDLIGREAEVLVTELAAKEEVNQLALARKEFLAEKQELLIQIGKSKQMTEHYGELLQEKKDAVKGERIASDRIERFLTYIAASTCVAFISILLAVTYAVRHRIECRHIEMAMEALSHANMPSEAREQLAGRLGRALPNFPRVS